MTNDLILSSVHRLPAAMLVPFVESLTRSGCVARKIMVAYDRDQERDNYLAMNGWEVAYANLQEGIHPAVWRFCDFAQVLKKVEARYVLAVDCRDVVFQTEPFYKIEELCGEDQYLCASEAINLQDDDWAVQNVKANFPEEWDRIADHTSYCAGTIAGGRFVLAELFWMIFRISITSPVQDQNPSDQAAFNLLKSQHTTNSCALSASLSTAFAATCGTILADKFQKHLHERPPVIKGATLLNAQNEPFSIVHQYDRYPDWAMEVRTRYGQNVFAEPTKPGEYTGFPEIPTFDHNILHDRIENKTVALVGPSPSVVDMGEEIDSADVVVRMNLGFPTKDEDARHVGSRTDIHYHCLHEDPGCGGPIPYEDLKRDDVLLCSPYPRRLDPFHSDVCRFLSENRKWRIPYHLIDLEYYLALCRSTGTRPNTGIAAIMDLFAHVPAELRIYGFTFFEDGHRKAYKEVSDETLKMWLREQFTGNHHQEPQRQLIRDLVEQHHYVKPDAACLKALGL